VLCPIYPHRDIRAYGSDHPVTTSWSTLRKLWPKEEMEEMERAVIPNPTTPHAGPESTTNLVPFVGMSKTLGSKAGLLFAPYMPNAPIENSSSSSSISPNMPGTLRRRYNLPRMSTWCSARRIEGVRCGLSRESRKPAETSTAEQMRKGDRIVFETTDPTKILLPSV
jgi:hypothetical protein